MYIFIPLLLMVVSLLVSGVVVWRKFPYLKKLSVDSLAGAGSTIQATVATRRWYQFAWLNEFVPELKHHWHRINWAEHKAFWLAEVEKMLRWSRIVFSKIDRLASSLIGKIKNSGAITVEEDETEEAVELTTSAKLDKTATQEQAKRDEQALIIAIAKEPKNPELYRQLGEVYLSLDEVADAIESFSTALKFDPENEAIKRKLAKLQPELESEK